MQSWPIRESLLGYPLFMVPWLRRRGRGGLEAVRIALYDQNTQARACPFVVALFPPEPQLVDRGRGSLIDVAGVLKAGRGIGVLLDGKLIGSIGPAGLTLFDMLFRRF